MTAADHTSLFALGVCLVLLALVAGVSFALFGRNGGARRSRAAARPYMHDGVPEPTRRSARGPLWVEGSATVLEPDGQEPASLEAAAILEPDDPEPVATVELPYLRRRFLLTEAEREFFAVLRDAAPQGWYVFPQVRLANLVQLKPGTRNWKPHFSRVAQKCVDFVLCDGAAIAPRLVVELDDASHKRPDRQARDQFVDAALRAAELPILHVPWQRRYDRDRLAEQIAAAVGLGRTQRNERSRTMRPEGAASTASRSLLAAQGQGSVGSQTTVQRWACRACSAEVSATAKFCKSCGVVLEL